MKTKKIIILAIAAIALMSCLTMPVALPLAERTMTRTIEVENKSADQLYVLSNMWVSDTFKSAEAVIEYSDKDAGIIMGNGVYDKFIGMGTRRYKYTVKIEVKDNKARFTAVGLNVSADIGSGYSSPSDFYENGWQELRPVLLRLANSYQSRIKSTEASDW